MANMWMQIFVCALAMSNTVAEPENLGQRPAMPAYPLKSGYVKPLQKINYDMYEGSYICAYDKKSKDVIAISSRKVCDGVDDCYDGIDEEGCGPKCKSPMIKCNTADRCVMPCNRINECPGGEDEAGCPEDEPCRCAIGQYQCRHADICIPAGKVCDGTDDCPDHDDEMHCATECSCADGEYRCLGGGKCVGSEAFCDQVYDCPFGDDENDCADACECVGGEYKCLEGPCIHGSKVCDNFPDCPFVDDEMFCYN